MQPPQWTLSVEGLGKIQRAEVRTHPLMLLVGENNSGKSYLASLLWGVMALGTDLFPEDAPPWDSYRACSQWLKNRIRNSIQDNAYVLGQDDLQLFVSFLKETLAQNKDAIVRRIFNHPDLRVAGLTMDCPPMTPPLSLRVHMSGRNPSLGLQEGELELYLSWAGAPQDMQDAQFERLESILYLAIQVIAMELLLPGGANILSIRHPPKAPVFLPASRSGFMLLYKSVIGQQLQKLLVFDRSSQPGVELTAPAVHFLNILSLELQGDHGPYAEEADFLERNALPGRITLRRGAGANEFLYHHADQQPPLSMALSSSLVTELAPIILILRHLRDFPVLILEEPEAHLHPRLQRLLARVIVRLIRKGVWVWVTTHSENFCQQINNFMKLGAHPDRASLQRELGYDEQDYLLADEVVGYQFENEGLHSTVKELPKSEHGLAMPTFNQELRRLGEETLLLQRRMVERP